VYPLRPVRLTAEAKGNRQQLETGCPNSDFGFAVDSRLVATSLQ